MKTIITVLLTANICFAQRFFVSPDATIGVAMANKGYKGEFGISGRLGVGVNFDRYSISATGGASNYTFSDKGFTVTDNTGVKTNQVNSSYSSTFYTVGIKANLPLYAPNGDGIYFYVAPEYNIAASASVVQTEENKPTSSFNKDYKIPTDLIGNSLSIDFGVNYRIVGEHGEIGFGAGYKRQFSSKETFPSLGMFGLNLVYQFNFGSKE